MVDVFVTWDGMSDEELADQDRAADEYSIGDGAIGYLWVSPGMLQESMVVRSLFKEVFAESEPVEFGFDERMEVFVGVAKLLEERRVPVDVKYVREVEERRAGVEQVLQRRVDGRGSVGVRFSSLNEEQRVVWLRSLVALWKLGWLLEKEGKRPCVEVLW